MFDGLIDVLMEWLVEAWCWFLDILFGIALFLLQLFDSIFIIDASVPSVLSSFTWDPVILDALAYFFPLSILSDFMIVFIFIEMIFSFLVPIFRSFYDLIP
jgi:hypothetical protein